METGELVDRDAEISQFQNFIAGSTKTWLLVYHGLAGLGKSTLLRYLNQMSEAGYFSLWIDCEETRIRTDFYGLINELDHALEKSGLAPGALSAYQVRSQQIDQKLTAKLVEANLNIEAQKYSNVSQVKYKVIIDLAGALLQIRADAARERIELWFDTAALAGKPWIAFIDHWDSLVEFGTPEIYAWILDEFLSQASKKLAGFRAVLANSSALPKTRIAEAAIQISLSPLRPEDSTILLSREEVIDPAARQFILERSGGNPFLIKLAAQLWKERPDLDLSGLEKELPVQAAAGWILDQMSERMKDPRSRTALKQGVVLEWFDRDVLACVCEATDFSQEWYTHFIRYPFVENVWKRAGCKQFVRLVRRIMVNALWLEDHDHNTYCHLHRNAHDWFAARAREGMG